MKGHKIAYLQLLNLIYFDEKPKKVKCSIDNEVYIWDEKINCYRREQSPMNLSSFLSYKCSDLGLASDMSVIEVIEQ